MVWVGQLATERQQETAGGTQNENNQTVDSAHFDSELECHTHLFMHEEEEGDEDEVSAHHEKEVDLAEASEQGEAAEHLLGAGI
eukprot:CAMPEP_0170465024 /NCGR_PEP_ID=MMETSP0123-20130129/9527_1 /TAXON_ID=182087 /ORGANISM="Favella ehrenbergii, Strain Fehren 1" /LENGTH=83 /DNA_ID=CAMNT_0010730825 /DNA_START=438 /DNA_END=692 /DNA_ORIENTATION=-